MIKFFSLSKILVFASIVIFLSFVSNLIASLILSDNTFIYGSLLASIIIIIWFLFYFFLQKIKSFIFWISFLFLFIPLFLLSFFDKGTFFNLISFTTQTFAFFIFANIYVKLSWIETIKIKAILKNLQKIIVISNDNENLLKGYQQIVNRSLTQSKFDFIDVKCYLLSDFKDYGKIIITNKAIFSKIKKNNNQTFFYLVKDFSNPKEYKNLISILKFNVKKGVKGL